MTEIMQMVIDNLGVKVGEIFKIKCGGYVIDGSYHFDKDGLLKNENNVDYSYYSIRLVLGEKQIVKLPFKPVSRESYQFVSWDGDVYTTQWRGTLQDYYCFNAKNCFRPEEEITEEDKKRIDAEMKKEYDGQ